jgi:pimeloyl-ACP methyl ester carboxylesterase
MVTLAEKAQPRSQAYGRRPALVLLNGLAEQAESWFPNHAFWRRTFTVHMPNLLVYDGAVLHQRIERELPISVGYLVEQLHLFLTTFVQTPPYHLVASSLGGKIAIEYAARYPDQVGRMVLLCPAGLGEEERLPLVPAVQRKDVLNLVESVFCDEHRVEPSLVAYYRERFADRRWRRGLVRTVRDTRDHSVRERLSLIIQPTLLVAGREDRIVNPAHAVVASRELPRGLCMVLPRCGHAPQLENPRLVNRLVRRFLTRPLPAPLRAMA